MYAFENWCFILYDVPMLIGELTSLEQAKIACSFKELILGRSKYTCEQIVQNVKPAQTRYADKYGT